MPTQTRRSGRSPAHRWTAWRTPSCITRKAGSCSRTGAPMRAARSCTTAARSRKAPSWCAHATAASSTCATGRSCEGPATDPLVVMPLVRRGRPTPPDLRPACGMMVRCVRRGLVPVALLLAIACSTHSSTFSIVSGPCAASTVTFAHKGALHVDVAADDVARSPRPDGGHGPPGEPGHGVRLEQTDRGDVLDEGHTDPARRSRSSMLRDSRHDPGDDAVHERSVPTPTSLGRPTRWRSRRTRAWFGDHGIEVGDRARCSERRSAHERRLHALLGRASDRSACTRTTTAGSPTASCA